jgi:hypothetical protein
MEACGPFLKIDEGNCDDPVESPYARPLDHSRSSPGDERCLQVKGRRIISLVSLASHDDHDNINLQ